MKSQLLKIIISVLVYCSGSILIFFGFFGLSREIERVTQRDYDSAGLLLGVVCIAIGITTCVWRRTRYSPGLWLPAGMVTIFFGLIFVDRLVDDLVSGISSQRYLFYLVASQICLALLALGILFICLGHRRHLQSVGRRQQFCFARFAPKGWPNILVVFVLFTTLSGPVSLFLLSKNHRWSLFIACFCLISALGTLSSRRWAYWMTVVMYAACLVWGSLQLVRALNWANDNPTILFGRLLYNVLVLAALMARPVLTWFDFQDIKEVRKMVGFICAGLAIHFICEYTGILFGWW